MGEKTYREDATGLLGICQVTGVWVWLEKGIKSEDIWNGGLQFTRSTSVSSITPWLFPEEDRHEYSGKEDVECMT